MIKLRPYKESDAGTILQWLGDEREFREWCADRYEKYPISAEEMNAFYSRCRETQEFYEMTALDEEGIVGHLAMRFTGTARTVLRFGFVIIDPKKRGRGYGRKMLNLALKYAFEILRVEKVTLGVFENNEQAYWCYRSAGFRDCKPEKPESYLVMGEEWSCREMETDYFTDRSANTQGTERLTHWDVMTGMYNQWGFLERLEEWNRIYEGTGEKILLVCVDVDHLANINGVYGHSEGDVAIQTLSKIIDDSLSDKEICAHMGSDEFVVALHGTGEEKGLVLSLIHAITGRLENYNRISDKEYSLDINFSYTAVTPSRDMSMDAALDEAFANKRIDKNNRREFSPSGGMDTDKEYNSAEEKKVEEIIDGNCFRYAFQPIVDAKTGEIYGYEALMRAELNGTVSPFTVLKYATKGQRLYDIERATFFNVLQEVQKKKEVLTGKQVFVNSIPGYLLDFTDYEKLRRQYEDVFKLLTVEITEQTELYDKELNILLERSAADGFGIAIDDYGTGYSNTSSLLRYLPNCLKIDRLLISNVQEEPKKQHFVKNVIEFAHDNGFLALAEGVETSAELKAVINMGVDLIQGYYTAKPSYDIIQQLPKEIKNEIINTNIDTLGQTNRKIFVVTGERELPLMRLALEQYTGILLSDQNVALVGNPDYVAGMAIKIKDGSKCRLTLRNVHLESVQELPCIDIGKNAQLTIVLEEENELNKVGIRVPEGSSLRIEGKGKLSVYAKGIRCYGIGNSCSAGVGDITCSLSGTLHIGTEGNESINLGGGIYRRGEGINITGGRIEIDAASEKGIGIGCNEGSMPINIENCSINVDTKIGSGVGIGNLYGNQNIRIADSSVVIAGSGRELCGIGSIGKTAGNIQMRSCKVSISINGQNVGLIGNTGGGLSLVTEECRLALRSEGSSVWGIGSKDKSATIRGRNAAYEIIVRAGEYALIGAEEDHLFFDCVDRVLKINED